MALHTDVPTMNKRRESKVFTIQDLAQRRNFGVLPRFYFGLELSRRDSRLREKVYFSQPTAHPQSM